MINTGTARKNSTITAHTLRTTGFGANRPTPSIIPSSIASTMEIAAAVKVPPMPGST